MISIGKIKQLIFDLIREKISWLNVWIQRTYQKGDQVTDDGWLMTANKATNDPAAPQPVGSPSFTLPDAPIWDAPDPTSNTVVFSGQRYVFNTDGWITRIRVWAPTLGVNISYSVVIIDNTDPADPQTIVISDPVLVTNDWTTLNVNSQVAGPGSDIIFFIAAENSSATTSWNHVWVFGGIENVASPITGTWNRRNQNNIIRINDIDDGSVDQTADLASITPNSILRFQVDILNFLEYEVLSAPSDNGTYFEYIVILIGQAGIIDPLDSTTITATIPTPDPTAYKEIVNNWPTNQPSFATVSGVLELGGVGQVVPDNAYGVDVEFQIANLSPDWDIATLSQLSSSATASSQVNNVIGLLQIHPKEIQSLALASTTNDFDANPFVKFDVTINMEAGTYLLLAAFEPSIDATNRRFVAALFVDNVQLGNEYEFEPKDLNEKPDPTKFGSGTFTKGDHDFRLDFGVRGGAGGATASIENFRMFLFRQNV